MNIKNNLNSIYKFSSFGLLAIGFFAGLAVMYLYMQPKLAYQGKTAKAWASEANGNQQNATFYREGWLSAMSKLPNPDPNPFMLTPTPTNVPTPMPTQSYSQAFFSSCSNGTIYCTCLYDTLHQIDPGNEATDYIAEQGSGNNAPMINAYAECNSRFSSK